ncbi:uncharacterized protein [Eurosta solidaginis]
MLVAQSGSLSALKLPVKRKSSQSYANNTSSRTKRKRQPTVRNSIESTISITDYTQLLDETEKFVEWSKSTEVINKTVSNMTKTNGHGGSRTTCIHIRAITINEVDNHHAESYAPNEEGFGSTTADEFNTLMRMMEDQPETNAKSTKRKIMEPPNICEKRPKLSNASANAMSQVAFEETEIPTARSAEAADNYVTDLFSPAKEFNHDTATFDESHRDEVTDDVANGNMSDIDEIAKKSCQAKDNIIYEIYNKNNNRKELSVCKNDTMLNCDKHQQDNSSITTSKSFPQTKYNTKLIIDERTNLPPAEMYTQLQVQVDLRKKLRKMRAKIKWSQAQHITCSRKLYERILPTASELLSRLNRSCIAMRKFKLKHPKVHTNIDDFVISSSKHNLLREILTREVTDDLVNEIFENCNTVGKNKRCPLSTAAVQGNLSSHLQVEYDYNHLTLVENRDMPNCCIDTNSNIECAGENFAINNEQDECGAFDIMVKLLNLWRTEKVLGDEIYVECIFKPTKMSRKQAAKAFYALLKLAAKGFIVLQTTEKTAHLRGVQLGPASAKLIQKSDFNGNTLKRRHNGYRIHAN